MSRFKVGDRVRCVDAERSASLVFGTEYTVSRVMDARVCLDGAVSDCDWWFAERFELVPLQAAGSPDDWVTQDLVPSRKGIDEINWIFSGECHGSWVPFRNGTPITHGVTDKCGDIGQVRCRRRDYPQQPVEVHSGGPYVARSEYDRVCGEADSLQKQLDAWQEATNDQIQDLRHEVSYQERAKAELLNDMKKVVKERDALQKQVVSLQDHFRRLTRERDDALQHVEFQRDQIADLIDRQSEANRINPNGWPLVPVDPSCVPDGHRAVEVTRSTEGKLVSGPQRTIFMHNREHTFPCLVVEPIPTPPGTLPRPEFPAWIRAGWWMTMDAGGFWYISRDKPVATEPDPESPADSGTWNPPGRDDIQISHGITPSMRAIPANRWREAKWQIE